jgi:excisionase family DNA binding protein
MYTRPYTTKEIAEVTGFHPTAIARAIREGRLKATKLGHDYIVWPCDLAHWIHNHPRPARLSHINTETLR